LDDASLQIIPMVLSAQPAEDARFCKETQMPSSMNVAVIVGSLRKGSYTRKIARALIQLAPKSLACHEIDIGELAMYDEDFDRAPPASWKRFREQIAEARAVLLVTPEYNRSIPACLKNALDVGSRPEGKNLWDGKPAGIVSVTPYQMGAMAANHAVRQALVFLNMPAMQQPEAYIGNVKDLLDSRGALKNLKTRKFLSDFLAAFERWAVRVAGDDAGTHFDAFLKERERIATAYSSGNPKPLDAIAVREGNATFFPPRGPIVQGNAAVAKTYYRGAKMFSPGSKNKWEVLDAGASGEMGFLVGLQRFEGKIAGKNQKMTLRTTEIFKRVHGAWKLVHRHADEEPQSS
jgi:NAD(P)H-dependent FMN reductase/ketosteroid isomerase-like protein